MKKKFDIRKTFETFLREPLSILTEGLFQIVNLEGNIFGGEKSFNVDFVNKKPQITLVNNGKMYNLLTTVMHKRQMLEHQKTAK